MNPAAALGKYPKPRGLGPPGSAPPAGGQAASTRDRSTLGAQSSGHSRPPGDQLPNFYSVALIQIIETAVPLWPWMTAGEAGAVGAAE